MAKIKLKIKNSGFVILFAVTLAAILLSIALGVSNIALKEIKFGTSAKDANEAFFAADSGIESALFNDKTPGSYPIGTTTFPVSGLGSTGQGCANVSISKIENGATPPLVVTTITAKGYNLGGDVSGSCNPPSSSVEREIETRY